MNTYLIPVTESFGYEYCYYALVHADTSEEAYIVASALPNVKDYDHMVCKDKKQYKIYRKKLSIPKHFFYKTEKSDIMKLLFNQLSQEEKDMADLLYDTIYMGDYNKNIADLAHKALPETWTLKTDEENAVLKKYLSKTLERLYEERKVVTTDNYFSFNTGLFTNNYEDIYILAEKSNSNSQKEWVFKEFCTEYRFDSTDITEIPERADYFEDPSLLLFNWHYPVRVQYGHILDDEKNVARLPESVRNSNMKLQIFTGVIDTSIKKVIANYKLAVPQYYDGIVQLLIPLYFENDNKPDLALTVTRKNGYYQGHTCLTLDMAYNNARLIAKPESNWLSL